MHRRGFLTGVGAAAFGITAGCTTDSTTNTESPQDRDGDGVPDKHDYAPTDPEVQSRSDVVTPTRGSTATPTASRTTSDTSTATATFTPTPTSTATATSTPTPTSVPSSARTNTIQADNGPLEGYTHHAEHYSVDHATVRIYSDLLDNSFPRGADLMAVITGYPGSSRSGDVFDYHRSNSFTPPSRGDTVVTVEFDSSASPSVPFYYWLALIPSNTNYSSLEADNVEFLCETDRLQINRGNLSRSRHPSEPGSETTSRYTRKSAEGCYTLDFSGTSYSRNWDAGFTVFKHGYIEDLNGQRYNDRRYYVYEALNEGLADEFGRILHDEAEANGITGDREKVEFLIDFVQNLPYIPDDVSTGYDDYTKRHIETIIDGGGDCEDSAIMLASLLLSDSFGYGTALLLLPGHAAIGVKGGDNIDGAYYEKDGNRYYYIETTGRGWSVGEIPDEYRGEKAYVRVF